MVSDASCPAASDETSALETLAMVQAQASYELGRLDGRLSNVAPHIAWAFSARITRDTLFAVLTQEGHHFTEPRFAAWFAGLSTLSDEPLRFAQSARGLVDTALGELAESRWGPLAAAALDLRTALLAPREQGDAMARAAARAGVDEAGALVSALTPRPLPFPGLCALHNAVGQSVRFALAERTPDLLKFDNLQLVVERERPPSPRWPLELACGDYLHACRLLPAALPLIGAIRLDAARPGGVASRILQAEALAQALARLNKAYETAVAIDAEAAALFAHQRAHSRAPQLYVRLRAFGPLRCAQIETMLGATRLGVRSMLRVLDDAGVLDAQTIAGAKVYSARPSSAAAAAPQLSVPESAAFSQASLEEFDASMADIDALLSRYPAEDVPGQRP